MPRPKPGQGANAVMRRWGKVGSERVEDRQEERRGDEQVDNGHCVSLSALIVKLLYACQCEQSHAKFWLGQDPSQAQDQAIHATQAGSWAPLGSGSGCPRLGIRLPARLQAPSHTHPEILHPPAPTCARRSVLRPVPARPSALPRHTAHPAPTGLSCGFSWSGAGSLRRAGFPIWRSCLPAPPASASGDPVSRVASQGRTASPCGASASWH